MILLIVLALLLLLAVTSLAYGVDTRPTGLGKWGDPPDRPAVIRF